MMRGGRKAKKRRQRGDRVGAGGREKGMGEKERKRVERNDR